MPHQSGSLLGTNDADDVDPDAAPVDVVRPQPRGREPPQPGSLAPGDGFDGRAEAHAAPGLDLAEHQPLTVLGDQVQLAVLTAPVAVEHCRSALLQIARGKLLAIVPQRAP